MYLIRSALDGLFEDVVPPGIQPTYDTSTNTPAMSLAQDGAVLEHPGGQPVRLVLAPHTNAELERGAHRLLRQAARRVRPEEVRAYFAERDLFPCHLLDSPEVVVGEGLDDIEREPVMLVMADSTFLGLVARQGELSSVLIFNTPAVVLTDDNAPNFPRVPLPPRLQGVPHETQANRKARLRAEGRAKALLFRYLVPEQKWELRAYRRITVIGQDGRTYRIYAWHGMNVRLVENGQETYTFCIVPKPEHRLPVFDLILAQKVLIETSLPDFFKLAVQRSYAPS